MPSSIMRVVPVSLGPNSRISGIAIIKEPYMAVTITRSPRIQSTQRKKFAVLIDGSAVYSASRSPESSLRGGEDRRLNYLALTEVLTRQVDGLATPTPGDDTSIWTMWTSAAP